MDLCISLKKELLFNLIAGGILTSGNPTLDKNLECIKRYNPKLANDLLNLPCLTDKIELTETDLKEPNLTFNGFPLHSTFGAEIEAKEIFSTSKNNKLSMHIIYGLGLGYLFDEFCTNSKGKVFLIEENLQIFRVTLELVDLSKILSKENVFVFSDIESFSQFFVNFYEYKADVEFKTLNSYKQLYKNTIEGTFKRIETIMGSCIANYNTMKLYGLDSLHSMIANIPYTIVDYTLDELKDIYKDKTALIVSAGPSLDLNIETIKANRDKMVIFCVGTALKALVKNEITPDFVVVIETRDCSEQIAGVDLSQINMIMEPYTNTEFFKFNSKTRILFPDKSSHANNIWAKIMGKDISKDSSKGTVSYTALLAAKTFGCNKIILIGQDLAYINNQCYSKDSPYSELVVRTNPQTGKPEIIARDYEKYIKDLSQKDTDISEEICKMEADLKLKMLNDTLYFVKGVSGEMIPTQAGYAGFIEHFKEFALQNKDLDLINSSMIGAQIDGYKNIPLEDALINSPVVEKIQLNPKPVSKNSLCATKNLDKEIANLLNILEEIKKAKDYILKYEKELSLRKVLTQEAQSLFKQILDCHDKITFEHFNKEALYQLLAFNETIELQYAIKITEKLDTERTNTIFSLLKTYFENVENNINNVIQPLKGQIERINEIVNSKS